MVYGYPSLEQPAPGLGDPAEPGENEGSARSVHACARERTGTDETPAGGAAADAPSSSATPRGDPSDLEDHGGASAKGVGTRGSGCAGSRCGASRTRTPHPRRCFPREISGGTRLLPKVLGVAGRRAGGDPSPTRNANGVSGWNARPANASAAETTRRRRRVSETPYLPLGHGRRLRRREKRRDPRRGTDARNRNTRVDPVDDDVWSRRRRIDAGLGTRRADERMFVAAELVARAFVEPFSLPP